MKNCLMLIIVAVLCGCNEPKPTAVDGQSSLVISARIDTSSEAGIPKVIPAWNANVLLTSEYGVRTFFTNANGVLDARNLPASTYSFSIRMVHPLDQTVYFVASKENLVLGAATSIAETLMLQPNSVSGIALNEIYTAGPVNAVYYFYDLYLELYNSSSETKYLDGMMIMRFSGNSTGHGPGYDERGDGQIQGVTYVYRFPGSPGGRQYPFPSGKFLVCASKATNHTLQVANSYDLSNADWEFYNQYSANDMDNPAVPNILNMKSESTVEFLLGLSDDVVVVASGVDSVWQDGIAISTVLDAVEYQSSLTSRKTLDPRLDRGFVLSPPKYSGKSMQRRVPGGDVNNSSFDFEILARATPGRQ